MVPARVAVGWRHGDARRPRRAPGRERARSPPRSRWRAVSPFDELAAGLAAVRPAPWRMELRARRAGVVVLNDAYNANPTSMAAALEALARVRVPGRRIAVLGEMRELGDHERGRARSRSASSLGAVAVDVARRRRPGRGAASPRAAARRRRGGHRGRRRRRRARRRRRRRARGDAVLVKASRAVGLELVAAGLRARARSGRSRRMIALLIGRGAAFVVCIFGTPSSSACCGRKGIGQQIRDDGPIAHPHVDEGGHADDGRHRDRRAARRRLPRRAHPHRADQVRARRASRCWR